MTTLEHTLAAILALDQPSLAETRVWPAFIARAAIDPALAAAQREQYAGLAELVALLIRAAQTHGQARPELDPDREADGVSESNASSKPSRLRVLPELSSLRGADAADFGRELVERSRGGRPSIDPDAAPGGSRRSVRCDFREPSTLIWKHSQPVATASRARFCARP